MMEENPNSIVHLLIKHEEAIADLYAICSRVFTDNADFWNMLVIEEKAHADVLRELRRRLETEQVLLNPRKFNTTGVQTAIDHVNKQKPAVEDGSCTMVRALAIALDIEQAIIDRNFFEVFDTDSAVIKREFAELRTHTIEHSGRLAALLRKMKGE